MLWSFRDSNDTVLVASALVTLSRSTRDRRVRGTSGCRSASDTAEAEIRGPDFDIEGVITRWLASLLGMMAIAGCGVVDEGSIMGRARVRIMAVAMLSL